MRRLTWYRMPTNHHSGGISLAGGKVGRYSWTVAGRVVSGERLLRGTSIPEPTGEQRKLASDSFLSNCVDCAGEDGSMRSNVNTSAVNVTVNYDRRRVVKRIALSLSAGQIPGIHACAMRALSSCQREGTLRHSEMTFSCSPAANMCRAAWRSMGHTSFKRSGSPRR